MVPLSTAIISSSLVISLQFACSLSFSPSLIHTHTHTHTHTNTHTHTHTHREPGSSSDTGFSPASRRQHRPFCALWAGPILFPGKKSTLIHTAWTSESPAGCPGPWHTTLLVRVLKLKAQGANSTCLQFWLAGSVFKCECGSCSLSLLATGSIPPHCLTPPPLNSHISCIGSQQEFENAVLGRNLKAAHAMESVSKSRGLGQGAS